jgi:4-hydroxybenzoate polyprenyltransferase
LLGRRPHAPDQCLKLFKSNTIVGLLIILGLAFGEAWVWVKPLV